MADKPRQPSNNNIDFGWETWKVYITHGVPDQADVEALPRSAYLSFFAWWKEVMADGSAKHQREWAMTTRHFTAKQIKEGEDN